MRVFTPCSCSDMSTLLPAGTLTLQQTWQITGDNALIAREMARTIGMGGLIRTAEGLPEMSQSGGIPPNLGRDYGAFILAADGFAQVRAWCSWYGNSLVVGGECMIWQMMVNDASYIAPQLAAPFRKSSSKVQPIQTCLGEAQHYYLSRANSAGCILIAL